jgi:hypothetical protein
LAPKTSGFYQELLLSRVSHAEIFFAFAIPRVLLVSGFIYAFHITMLPWEDDWLIWFDYPREGVGNPDPDPIWTRFHCVITTSYFITILAFNITAAVWAALKVRSFLRGFVVAFLLIVVLDWTTYVCGFAFLPNFWNFDEFPEALIWLFWWPHLLYSLLCLHSHPVFAAFFYPLKWLILVLMLRGITQRTPRSGWTGSG